MKVNKRAMELLAKEFMRDGKVAWSATHTCAGTLPLWGKLVLAGFVKPTVVAGLGHRFAYEITDEGRKVLES